MIQLFCYSQSASQSQRRHQFCPSITLLWKIFKRRLQNTDISERILKTLGSTYFQRCLGLKERQIVLRFLPLHSVSTVGDSAAGTTLYG